VASQRGEDCNWERLDREQHPVNCVSGDDAKAFCSWTGGRLPTDQEWFAEASDSGRRRFPWGGDPAKGADDALFDCAHSVLRGPDGPRGCDRKSTAPVCSLPAGNSVSGLCDMSGNLWEFTAAGGSAKTRERGGSFMDRAPLPMSITAAETQRRFLSWGEFGFRCVRP
jgi:formylglycine-generating enzyme required for sulfatase activity